MGAAVENYFWIEFAITYSDNEAYEPVVTKLLEDVNDEVMRKLEAQGKLDMVSKFIYLNDADKGQDVWGGYPKENVRKLQEIRSKYDPERVFTDLMPGGWKVADYEV